MRNSNRRVRAAAAVLLGAALGLSASQAEADDPAARALLQRQQQSDEFSLRLQQSIQNQRSGTLSPQQRLELDSLQRDQRLRQSDTFYRQRIGEAAPPSPGPAGPALRRAEVLRMEQERQSELTRFRREAAQGVERSKPSPRPKPLAEPTIVVP
jgi:hypothetical protein